MKCMTPMKGHPLGEGNTDQAGDEAAVFHRGRIQVSYGQRHLKFSDPVIRMT